MPPQAKRPVVTAPPSAEAVRRARVERVRSLHDKGAGRSAAETRELLDIALTLLPPGTLGP